MEIPERLLSIVKEKLTTPLPQKVQIDVKSSLPTYIYNWYNLDPKWGSEIEVNRILILEPSAFQHYPISEKSVDFMIQLAKNIEAVQIFVGEFEEFVRIHQPSDIYFKEHPLNTNYTGTEVARDWMFDVTGYFSSFFGYWKKCKKQLKY
jgi:deoxyribodipyrimidine photo-lyase